MCDLQLRFLIISSIFMQWSMYPDYVPHVNMDYKFSATMIPEARKDRFNKTQCREATKTKQAQDNQERSNAASILLELSLRHSSANEHEQSEVGVEEEKISL